VSWLFALAGLLTAALPFAAVREAWVPLALAAATLAFCAAAALRGFILQCPSEFDWLSACAFVPAVLGLAQYFTGRTVHREATLHAALFSLAAAGLFVAARAVLADLNLRRDFLNAALLAGTAVAIFQIAGFAAFPNRNHHAAFLVLTMPLALLRAIEERRGWLAFCALTMGASVALGGSRAGMALIVAEGAVLLAGARYRFAAIAVVAIGGLAFAAEIGARDDGHRRELFASAIEIARENPVFGAGLGGAGLGAFETAYPAHAFFDNGLIVDHAHSDWLEWLAEMGLLGVAPLLLLALWSAREAMRQPWAVGMVAVYLHAAIDYPLHKPTLVLWHYALLAALVAGRAAAKRRVQI